MQVIGAGFNITKFHFMFKNLINSYDESERHVLGNFWPLAYIPLGSLLFLYLLEDFKIKHAKKMCILEPYHRRAPF